jgi:hypothetical protein
MADMPEWLHYSPRRRARRRQVPVRDRGGIAIETDFKVINVTLIGELETVELVGRRRNQPDGVQAGKMVLAYSDRAGRDEVRRVSWSGSDVHVEVTVRGDDWNSAQRSGLNLKIDNQKGISVSSEIFVRC